MENNKQKSYKTLVDLSIAFDNKELTKDELINHAFDLGQQYQKGAITWIKCQYQLPPPKENNKYGYSNEVLITDGQYVEKGFYCHNPSSGEPFWSTDFKPTHWAPLNLP